MLKYLLIEDINQFFAYLNLTLFVVQDLSDVQGHSSLSEVQNTY